MSELAWIGKLGGRTESLSQRLGRLTGIQLMRKWQQKLQRRRCAKFVLNVAVTLYLLLPQLLTKRKKIFKDAKLPEAIWDARVNALNRLHAAELHSAGYGFAISSNKNLGLILCKGMNVKL